MLNPVGPNYGALVGNLSLSDRLNPSANWNLVHTCLVIPLRTHTKKPARSPAAKPDPHQQGWASRAGELSLMIRHTAL